jgi:fluoroacetyl-CoA thioesterase
VPAVSPHYSGFADMPPVFATAFLVGFVEWTCIEAIRPLLADGQQCVGIRVDLSHSAATPVGMGVTAEVELVEVGGRRLRFKVACRDDKDIISDGFHERFVIDRKRFLERVARKAAG